MIFKKIVKTQVVTFKMFHVEQLKFSEDMACSVLKSLDTDTLDTDTLDTDTLDMEGLVKKDDLIKE